MTTKRSRTCVWIFALLLATCATGLLAQRETPGEHDARMQCWREARFGMFIHWGLYSIPAGEWKGRTDHAEFGGDFGTLEQEVPATGIPGADWESCITQVPENDVYEFFTDSLAEFNPGPPDGAGAR